MLAHQLDLFGLPVDSPENPEQAPIVTNETTDETNTTLRNNSNDSVVVIRPSANRDVFITAGDYKKESTDTNIETYVKNEIDPNNQIAGEQNLSDGIGHISLEYEEATGDEVLIDHSENEVTYFFNDESINSDNDYPEESDIHDTEQAVSKTTGSEENVTLHQGKSETEISDNNDTDEGQILIENDNIEIPEDSEHLIETTEDATDAINLEELQDLPYGNIDAPDTPSDVTHIEEIPGADNEQDENKLVESEQTALQEITIETTDDDIIIEPASNDTSEAEYNPPVATEAGATDELNLIENSIEAEFIDTTNSNANSESTDIEDSKESGTVENANETGTTYTANNISETDATAIEPEIIVETPPIKISEPTESNDELVYRGKKSLASLEETEAGLKIPADEELRKRQYYNMRETAKMFDVNQSLLRYWESEFNVLQPKKNKKGDRYFRPVDIKNLALIYHLLKVRKFTIEGAKDYLQSNKKALDNHQLIQQLEKLKGFLLELKNTL